MKVPVTPTEAQLRRRYLELLHGDPAVDGGDRHTDGEYARWRELKRLVIVYGLPRGSEAEPNVDPASSHSSEQGEGDKTGDEQKRAPCSLRGQIWKAFLGVDAADRTAEYAELVERGASQFDSDIRNDTFRTFRGDPAFAQRVPESKLVRLLNVFINELGSGPDIDGECKADQPDGLPKDIRYVQGMNILCAPLLYVLPEADAYYTFCRLIVRHCPKYMAPQVMGAKQGCLLVDKCLELLDPDLYHHLLAHEITAQIYALPLILSLFACVPPLPELLRVWDVLFAMGVHFVVVLAVAHTVLLREQLLQKDMDLMKVLSLRFAPPLQADLLVSVALQLYQRLPDDLVFEIARHPFEDADAPASLPFSSAVQTSIVAQMRRRHGRRARVSHSSASSKNSEDKATTERAASTTSSASGAQSTSSTTTTLARPRWKL